MWDAPEVIGYRKPFEVTPFKRIENVLQDDVIRHTLCFILQPFKDQNSPVNFAFER